MPSNQRTGKAAVYIDGALYETMKDSKLNNAGGTKRKGVVGVTRYGYSEEEDEITIDVKFVVGYGPNAPAFVQITDSEVQFTCDTGEIYVCTGCFYMEGDLDPSNHVIAGKIGVLACSVLPS